MHVTDSTTYFKRLTKSLLILCKFKSFELSFLRQKGCHRGSRPEFWLKAPWPGTKMASEADEINVDVSMMLPCKLYGEIRLSLSARMDGCRGPRLFLIRCTPHLSRARANPAVPMDDLRLQSDRIGVGVFKNRTATNAARLFERQGPFSSVTALAPKLRSGSMVCKKPCRAQPKCLHPSFRQIGRRHCADMSPSPPRTGC